MVETLIAPENRRTLQPTLYASFAQKSLAEKAAGAFLDFGVPADDISLITKETYENGDADLDHLPEELEVAAKTGLSTTTPTDAASGAAKGAGIGLGVGIAAALGSLFIPGFGIVAGGGALASAIAGATGAAAAGAVAGSVHGYLKDQGVPDEVIAHYGEEYHVGGSILGVTLRPGAMEEDTAIKIISKYQGSHITTYETHPV